MRGLVLAALVALMAGCVYYPTIEDAGGARIRPENGRVVRQAAGAAFYVDLHSTGKYGEVLTGAHVAVARDTQLIGTGGSAVSKLEIPGTTVVAFRPGGPHVRLSGLTRQLVSSEVLIVTLVFQKLGNLGVVTVVE